MQPTMLMTAPSLQPKRTYTLSIRLTEAERAEVEGLARRLNLPSSFMARHFILQAIVQYPHSEEAAIGS
jgi:predicted transcriptional regulator